MPRLRPAAALLAALALALAPAAARAIPRPLNPTAAGAAQPKLLSDYERRVLSHELKKLMQDVRARRAKAAEDESLAPLREALAAAKAEGVSSNVQAAAKALSDAVETKLYEDPEIPAKIKRLQEVGNFLEYDSRLRREQRASRPAPNRTTATAEESFAQPSAE
jgi:LPS O-antigen subunit length determinant protein (WzzB/FepE family)